MSNVKQKLVMGLLAVFLCLSFAASAHSLSHLDDGAKTHCTLCYHQHQVNNLLPSCELHIAVERQGVVSQEYILPKSDSRHVSFFNSRAPPVSA
ncbi:MULTISPECIES: ABC-type zinc uptake system zinc chaperone [unclassified Shewanella]|uniref:ABC-type zinc uptake system zinc chaperone n=1 Tax=unclassified Shewanella TaxID=196818 RepID=UPI001C825EA1|nr:MULTISPECIES: ABC-type zinc uptake system zinc chaperone [unclassified Shewanella]MCG9730250.1 ABC-type zinc uptake system zinc chaperone [Shewanella sp. Isolate13]